MRSRRFWRLSPTRRTAPPPADVPMKLISAEEYGALLMDRDLVDELERVRRRRRPGSRPLRETFAADDEPAVVRIAG
jgi:hypothetical protein